MDDSDHAKLYDEINHPRMKEVFDNVNKIIAKILENIKHSNKLTLEQFNNCTKYLIYLDKLKSKLIWANGTVESIEYKLKHIKEYIKQLPYQKTKIKYDDYKPFWEHHFRARLHELGVNGHEYTAEYLYLAMLHLYLLAKRNNQYI